MNGSSQHILDVIGPAPDRSIRYADGATGVVDVFAPPASALGLVVLIHGGFWRSAYDRGHLRPLAAALAAAGWLVALPEYRRVGDPGGGWPGTLDDVTAILELVPAELGVPLAHTVVVGHSAGGHLAVLAAQRAATAPRAVVSLAGVLDLAAAHRARLSNGAVGALLGSEHPSASLLAEADPMVASIPSCQVHLIHGSLDTEVPPAYSAAYAERDARIRLALLDGIDHYDVIDPRSGAFDVLRSAIS